MTGCSRFADARDMVLVVAASRCHREALAEIYRRHAGAVYALARRLVGEQGEAESVVHDVFFSLWTGRCEFEPREGSLRSCLFALTYRHAAERFTAEGASGARESVAGGARRGTPALSSLGALEQEAVELAMFPANTPEDLAVFIGESEAAIKRAVRTGLTRIGVVEQG